MRIKFPMWMPACEDPEKARLTRLSVQYECASCGTCKAVNLKPVRCVLSLVKKSGT